MGIRIKNTFAISLVVFFVLSSTAAVVSMNSNGNIGNWNDGFYNGNIGNGNIGNWNDGFYNGNIGNGNIGNWNDGFYNGNIGNGNIGNWNDGFYNGKGNGNWGYETGSERERGRRFLKRNTEATGIGTES